MDANPLLRLLLGAGFVFAAIIALCGVVAVGMEFMLRRRSRHRSGLSRSLRNVAVMSIVLSIYVAMATITANSVNRYTKTLPRVSVP